MATKTAEAAAGAAQTAGKNAEKLFEQAVEALEASLQSGLKVQEEATRWARQMVESSATPEQWQAKAQEIITKALPQAQENVEQAFATAQVGTPAEAQQKMQDLWEASLAAMRENAQAMVQANAKAMEQWTEAAKQFATAGA